jgi:hypothetical protein
LQGDQPPEVRLAALEATTNYIPIFVQPEYRQTLRNLIPSMLDTIATSLDTRNEKNAQNALQMLIDVAELDPGFMKPIVGPVVETMFKISCAKNLEDATRRLALEFLVTLVENKPRMFQSMPRFANTIIDLLLQMMLDIPDISIQEWNKLEDN